MSKPVTLKDLAGSWALVTGASSGIGREFCVQLAAAGLNLVLVARRGELLQALGAELVQGHGIRCLALPTDLSRVGAAAELKARLEVEGISLRMLVNNAGCGHWGAAIAAEAKFYEGMMTLNVTTPTVLCRLFYVDLLRNAPSVLINVSSAAVYQPVPYMAAYAASKVALHNLSLALSEEWRSQGIHVQTLVPAPTKSEFDARAGAYDSGLVASREPPSAVVSLSLAQLASGRILVSSAKGTYMQRFFGALFPPAMVVGKVAEMFRPKNTT